MYIFVKMRKNKDMLHDQTFIDAMVNCRNESSRRAVYDIEWIGTGQGFLLF